jgi:hypothetical protein
LAAAVVRLILAAADRLWFREELFSAFAPEPPVVSAKAMADRRRAACRLLAPAVVRLILAAADRLWFQEELFSALAQERPAVSAKE